MPFAYRIPRAHTFLQSGAVLWTERVATEMHKDRVNENETLQALSTRLNVPACMLMRANGIYSPAWLLPGREIDVPQGRFCLTDAGVCPVRMMNRPVPPKDEEENRTVE